MTEREPLVFLIAGEESGDQLGGRLMAALKARYEGGVRFAGIGGRRMQQEGLSSLFPMSDLSVMGLAEVLPRLPLLIRRIGQTVAAAQELKPDVVVSIDAPDFAFRVARKLRRGDAATRPALVHYVAPSVWAWRPGRARKIARFLDHLLTLFPFEPPYFEREGLPASFVGHSVVEDRFDRGDAARFRAAHAIPADAPLLCVLPGSRRGEVERLLPTFGETVRRLHATRPDLRLVAPTAPQVASAVREALSGWGPPVVFISDLQDKIDAFAASDAALAASGTVALELAFAGLPFVTAYKVAPATAFIARRLLTTRYVNLVNILLDREAVPERLQENCTPDALVAATAPLLDKDGPERKRQVADLHVFADAIGAGDVKPSARAAEVVARVIDERRAR